MDSRAVCICAFINISNLTFFVFGLEVKYETFEVCDSNYGSVIEEITGRGETTSIWCATLCTSQTNCASSIHDPINKVCRLNAYRLHNSQTSGCVLVNYIEKQLCVEGKRCTYPVQNTRLCDGAGAGKCDESNGRLEVFLTGQWGTVCDDYWRDEFSMDYPNEIVTCRMYGFSSGTRRDSAYFGSGTGPILRDDVMCSGSETSILDCPSLPTGTNNCGHGEDVGVTCY